MLSWVVTFLVVALIAGILGFGGIAGVSVEIAKAIFFIAVILFLVSAVVGLVRGRRQRLAQTHPKTGAARRTSARRPMQCRTAQGLTAKGSTARREGAPSRSNCFSYVAIAK